MTMRSEGEGMARCEPSTPCHQSRACARCQSSLCSLTEQPVDGTVLRHSAGAWCPLFVDVRAVALLEAA